MLKIRLRANIAAVFLFLYEAFSYHILSEIFLPPASLTHDLFDMNSIYVYYVYIKKYL